MTRVRRLGVQGSHRNWCSFDELKNGAVLTGRAERRALAKMAKQERAAMLKKKKGRT